MECSNAVLESLYRRLKEPARRQRGRGQNVWNRIRANEWATSADIDDLLLSMDPRLAYLAVEELARVLELPFRAIFSRPRFLTAESVGIHSLSTVDTAALVIFLEDCGFAVDPEYLVQDAAQVLSDSNRLTRSELSILCYRHTRRRGTLVLRVPTMRKSESPNVPAGEEQRSVDQFTTSTGYRVEATLRGSCPVALRITGPRRPLERNTVHCDYCNIEYERGDPEENLRHRTWHARWQRVLDPRPLKRMSARLVQHSDPEEVRPRSPLWCHQEMYERAWAFKREMGFDFEQWGSTADGRDTDPSVHGYLMNAEDGAIAGACCFRMDGDRWNLCWIWIAPRYRRNGIVARRWQQFTAKFGDFTIEPPISPAMQSFVLKSGTELQQAEMREYQARTTNAVVP